MEDFYTKVEEEAAIFECGFYDGQDVWFTLWDRNRPEDYGWRVPELAEWPIGPTQVRYMRGDMSYGEMPLDDFLRHGLPDED